MIKNKPTNKAIGETVGEAAGSATPIGAIMNAAAKSLDSVMQMITGTNKDTREAISKNMETNANMITNNHVAVQNQNTGMYIVLAIAVIAITVFYVMKIKK